MIVFTRKIGETIMIRGDIAVTVVRVGPNDVRLGIVAPTEVSIVRGEIEPDDMKNCRIGGRLKDDTAPLTT